MTTTASTVGATVDLGVIGNCQVASLIDAHGIHVLLDHVASAQTYERYPAILTTTLARCATPDHFGVPAVAFSVCTFWCISDLRGTGDAGQLWGNYPQIYRLLGIVNCAMRLSRSWEDAM